jgi:hypothetical protein
MYKDLYDWLSHLESWEAVGIVAGALIVCFTLLGGVAKFCKNSVNAYLNIADFIRVRVENKKEQDERLKLYYHPNYAGNHWFYFKHENPPRLPGSG